MLFPERFRNLKTDKVVVGLRRIVPLGDLVHIETELYLHVRGGLVLMRHHRSILLCQLGISHRYDPIGCNRMSRVIRSIVCECAQSECVFVQIL